MEEKSTGIKHSPINVCVCLLLPHINRMVFMQNQNQPNKNLIQHEPIYRAWKFTFIHRTGGCAVTSAVYIQDAMLLTASFKQFDVISKEINSCGQRGHTKTKWLNHGKTLKLLKSTTARLIFLGPKLSGYKTLFVSFLNINSFAVNK